MDVTKIRLRTLITSLSTGAVMLTTLLLLGAIIVFQKGYIQDSIVQNNVVYARKLADTTDRYLTIAQRELKWSASQITHLNNPQQFLSETERLRRQSGFFNSVVIVNSENIVVAASPERLNVMGRIFTSDTILPALTSPYISEPFVSASGNYVISLSQPLFSDEGVYLGYIGGTIYLKKHSMLSDILNQHFYAPGTYIRIVDDNGMILFSHEAGQVGTVEVLSPSTRRQLKSGGSGRLVLQDNESINTGFAHLSQADWCILISGNPEEVRATLMKTVGKSICFILIAGLLVALLMIYLGTRVASPLEKLANIVRDGSNKEGKAATLNNIQDWYYEASLLKEALTEQQRLTQEQMSKLTEQAVTDPLTGLNNRRGFEIQYNRLHPRAAISIVAIDIDHFKRVNDRFGHDAGDAVLVMLAGVLQKACRKHDVVCRFGGEEFILLLPGHETDEAAEIAERLRQVISATIFPYIGHLTISAGVASSSDGGEDIQGILHRADEALYNAKQNGRNVVVTAPHIVVKESDDNMRPGA